MTTPTPPPSISRCDDDDIDRILLEACPTLFEVDDDDDDAVEDALGTIGIPPPADRNRHHHHQRADGKDGRRGKTTNNGSAKKNIKAGKRRTTPSTGGSDGSSSDAVARRQKTRNHSHYRLGDEAEEEGASTEAALRDVVLKTMSENNNNNNNQHEEEEKEEEEEDVEMGRSLRQENAEGEKNDGPSASAKSFGGSVDGLMKAAGEYRPAMSENYSNDMNNSNDNGFDAFDLDDFMADFVPPEMSNVLKESDAQRKDRLRRNREAAQLSRARKKKQLEEFANAAKVFREQFLQSNALVGKLANENHVLRMHLAHLARFVTADAATEAKKINLPSLPPPTLAMQYLQQQQQQQPISVGSPTVSHPATVPGGKIMIPPFNPHAYAKEAEVKRPASKRQQQEEERCGNLSPSPYNNNNKNSGQLSNTNSPKRQRTKKSSVVATATALALSTACVLNNTNKAATVVSRSGTAASIATNVGRLATRHLTALPDLPEGVSEGNGIIASPDLKQALEMNWTMPDQAEMEKDKHSKALAFASEAIKKLSFDNHDEDKRKVKEKTKEETAMHLWSEEDKNDKETHTMLLDKEANKVDPWFAAFRAARMHDVIQKMSRVDCAEVFQYKLQLEEDDDVNEQTTSAAAANIVTINPETPEQRIARKRSSGAIPLDDGSGYPQTTTSRTAFQTETQTTTTSSGEDNNNPSSSLVSMLLPPWEMTDGANDKSAAAMLRRLTKTFIVMFSKETGTYTTYACRLPIANL